MKLAAIRMLEKRRPRGVRGAWRCAAELSCTRSWFDALMRRIAEPSSKELQAEGRSLMGRWQNADAGPIARRLRRLHSFPAAARK